MAAVGTTNTRTIVDRHVRFRVTKDLQRHGAYHTSNGHVNYSAGVGNNRVVVSRNDRVEDDFDGPSPADELLQRRTVARPNGLHHLNGTVVNGFGDELSPEFDSVVRVLTGEFEERYEEAFRCACHELFLTPDNAQAVFLTTINSLFADSVINWGRIVAVLAFSGAVAAECVDKEMPNLVDQIVTWTSIFIDQRLASWIQQNGGWNGLVKFYGCGSTPVEPTGWPTLKTLCSCAVGAIGVLTLGALLVQK